MLIAHKLIFKSVFGYRFGETDVVSSLSLLILSREKEKEKREGADNYQCLIPLP